MPRSGDNNNRSEPRTSLTNLLAVWEAEEAWQQSLPSPHPLFNTRNHPYWPVHNALLRQIADTPATSAAEALGKFLVLHRERSSSGFGVEGALERGILRDAEHLGVMPPVGSEAPDAEWAPRLDAVKDTKPDAADLYNSLTGAANDIEPAPPPPARGVKPEMAARHQALREDVAEAQAAFATEFASPSASSSASVPVFGVEAARNQVREVCKEKGALWMRAMLAQYGVGKISDMTEDALKAEIARIGVPAEG